nr:MAG TPA: hypothetical protein [Caudoviricetes sp.]
MRKSDGLFVDFSKCMDNIYLLIYSSIRSSFL